MKGPYGQKLDAREYQRRVLELYERPGQLLTGRQQTMLRRRELELTIDHKLGVDFPLERREALWKAQQRLHRRHVPVLLLWLVGKAFGSKKSVEEPMYELVLREYGRVLSSSELSAMVDIPINQLPH